MFRRAAASATLAAAILLAAPAHPGAIVASPADADLTRALSLARGFDAERARFHERYRFAVQDDTVTGIEVITGVRRAVLVGEERRAAGEYLFGPRQLRERLGPLLDVVSIVAHLRFHPMNTFVFVPEYELSLGEGDARTDRMSLERTPIYQPPPTGARAPQQAGGPIIGARIEAAYDAAAVGDGARAVVVTLGGRTIARVVIDFSRID